MTQTTFRPLRIGDITVEFPVVLAALAGYSDLPYRLICRRLGAGYCTTEMTLDKCVLVKGKLRSRLLTLTNEDHPIAGQLTGNDPETMAQAAVAMAQQGFDVIDLNFACPVNKALSRRRGGYLMREPQRVIEITRAVIAAAGRPVTLKLRRSFEEADRQYSALWEIADGVFEAGAAGICLHARSVECKYSGRADWDLIAQLRRRFEGPTIMGSGDVMTPADALAMLDRTGVDAVTVARGGLGNPWFFRQVRDLAAGRPPYQPSLAEQKELLKDHFRGACDLYGPPKGSRIMRKFGIRYARLHPHPKEVRMAFVRVASAQQWHAVLDRYYGNGEDEKGN